MSKIMRQFEIIVEKGNLGISGNTKGFCGGSLDIDTCVLPDKEIHVLYDFDHKTPIAKTSLFRKNGVIYAKITGLDEYFIDCYPAIGFTSNKITNGKYINATVEILSLSNKTNEDVSIQTIKQQLNLQL